jgi:hypothetical protein
MGNIIAAEGTMFVCAACGKRSRDRYGFDPIDPGWDESCMLHAVLCREDSLVMSPSGRVAEVKDGGIIPKEQGESAPHGSATSSPDSRP